MITKNAIENLKSHLDVVDVISQFLELKKSGANFKACCPFHGEETPSFVVSPAKQIYHCFGCGVGGDSIKFVMEYEKLSYPETLEKLASMYNVSLEYDNDYKKIDSSIIGKINKHYEKLLVFHSNALDYLKQRGISSSSIERFEIGYASSSNDTINYLKTNFLNLADAKEFGIIDSGQNGLYARFIDRITFPIYTITGNIVGFGGRTISGHNAKYINSPQTKLFNKSRLLYGYHLAKDTIYKQKTIIVTEGYLDVVMLHQAGFRNTVATLGTALTNDHLPLLKRGDPKIIVAYDGDKAGLNAAYKASLLLSHSDFNGGVVIFEYGIDPADMVKNNKIDKLNEMFLNPIPFIPYVIDFIIKSKNLENPKEKQLALEESNEYLKTLNPILQEEYSSLIARKLNINSALVQVQHFNTQRTNIVNLSQADIAELSIIRAALQNDEFYKIVTQTLDNSMFQVHSNEFALLKNDKNNPTMMNIMLNEQLKHHTKETLEGQIIALSIPYYNQQLQQLKLNNDIDFKKKVKLIRQLQDKLKDLKSQKLVSFNIV
ncbi:MAG: DNA primase [Campylobacterota bacterium]|nr:DNA primase [Campylobacterota bacterium]